MSHIRPRVALTSALLAAGVAAGALTGTTAQALNGPAATDQSLAFTARLDIGDGDRACSGVLVAAQWLLTSSSCFTSSATPASGVPAKATKATIGRTDLSTTAGQVRTVVQLVPRTDRDVTLARLDKPVTTITPAAIATAAPAAGTSVTVAGYGRTKDEWSPMKMHTGTFTVGTASTTELALTGNSGASVCAGDTGGPALATGGGKTSLVALNARSWQGGCFGTDASETRTDAADSRVDDLASWVTSTTQAATVVDFDGDGQRDVAVGDPKATVGSATTAGLVRVIYGGGKSAAELTQDLDYVPGSSEASDAFGQTTATVDYNSDGYTDLVVGVPMEDIGTETNAGVVYVLYGSADGLGKGKAATTLQQGSGEGDLKTTTSEAGDHMGQALAAGTTTAGEPYLVIGVPGENQGDVVDAGGGYYLRGSVVSAIHQEKTGYWGDSETGDEFGASVAATGEHIAIGIPGEAIGDLADSGAVQILSHKLTSENLPTPISGLDQNDATVTITGSSEAGDLFGASLAGISYRPTATATAATDSFFAIGSPGEATATTNLKQAGRVVTLRVTAGNTITQAGDFNQNATDVGGDAETGDQVGATISAVNTTPGAVATTKTLLIAVGEPGEAVGTATGSGSVQVFSPLGAVGDSDVSVEPGKVGVPGTSGANQHLGASLTAAAGHLYLGLPEGPATYGSVYTVPWDNITAGASGAVTVYEPGKNGLPASGKAFGTTIQ
ncbi:trypsin-like serine protease [Streptomyces sp. NPDC001910]|uniref:trypsin-like serine protease n=1 Tax=Streptomyces sp. NPDC001910 TaxID=3154403 RepID=UPI003321C52F